MSTITRAREAHRVLIRALAALEVANQSAVLAFAQVMQEEHFRPLGFSSIHHYATEGLKFSHGKTMQFVRLAKDMKRLPALEQALSSGEISWTKARTVGSVATPENQNEWVERAKSVPRRELEKQADQVKKRARKPARVEQPALGQLPGQSSPNQLSVGQPSPGQPVPGQPAPGQSLLIDTPDLPAGDPPRRVSFELTQLQAAQFDKLMERSRRQGHRKAGETLLAALESLTSQRVTRVKVDSANTEQTSAHDASSPAPKQTVSIQPTSVQSTAVQSASVRPAAQVVLYRCESCESVATPTRRGMRTLSRPEASAGQCDAVEIRGDGSTKSTIPPRVRRAVLARDRFSCRRCHSTQFVDVHHLQRRTNKGAHSVVNCAALCRACHVNWHTEESRLIAAGVSSGRILDRAREFARLVE